MVLSVSACLHAGAAGLDDVNASHGKTLQAAKKSQGVIDGLAEKTDDIEQEYRQTLKLVEDLKVYNKKLEIQTQKQKERLAGIEQSIANVQVIQRQIIPLTERMIDSLDDFVQLDVPFHKEERAKRISMLRNNLDRPDVSTAEKFRQVLEAYKIESEYGRKINTYAREINIDGAVREVTMLRVGRVALMYQTPDMEHTGMWDSDRGGFVALDSSYKDAVRKGIRIANKQANIDILDLPVSAPEAK